MYKYPPTHTLPLNLVGIKKTDNLMFLKGEDGDL